MVGTTFLATTGLSRSAPKKSAMPVSIGYSGTTSNGFGFFKSTITVGVVRIVRLPVLVWQRATVLKYLGMVGPRADPTEVGYPFVVPSSSCMYRMCDVTMTFVWKLSLVT